MQKAQVCAVPMTIRMHEPCPYTGAHTRILARQEFNNKTNKQTNIQADLHCYTSCMHVFSSQAMRVLLEQLGLLRDKCAAMPRSLWLSDPTEWEPTRMSKEELDR